jgi:hypothetical protein
MSASRSASERLVILEQKVSHMEEELVPWPLAGAL